MIYHDIEISKRFIIEISEVKVVIFYFDNAITILPSLEDYRFSRGKLITQNGVEYVLLLSNSNLNSSKTIIEKLTIKCYASND